MATLINMMLDQTEEGQVGFTLLETRVDVAHAGLSAPLKPSQIGSP